ncbi:unnamed protein product, partial [Porites lobata]
MAQAHELPFAVANILSPNFPHPSRLSQTPVSRVLYVKPLTKESWQQVTQGTITNEEKDVRKKKRIRNRFTQRQINYLEDVFSRQMYLTRDERALLSKILYMTELQIRNWFQNRRYQFRNK